MAAAFGDGAEFYFGSVAGCAEVAGGTDRTRDDTARTSAPAHSRTGGLFGGTGFRRNSPTGARAQSDCATGARFRAADAIPRHVQYLGIALQHADKSVGDFHA